MHGHQHRIDLWYRALASVRRAIPDNLYRDVYDYINRFDEWGVGMDLLIDQLSEFDIQITREQFEHIQAAMASMRLGECDRIQYLREHAVIA